MLLRVILNKPLLGQTFILELMVNSKNVAKLVLVLARILTLSSTFLHFKSGMKQSCNSGDQWDFHPKAVAAACSYKCLLSKSLSKTTQIMSLKETI